MNCTTHHICDCKQAELDLARKRLGPAGYEILIRLREAEALLRNIDGIPSVAEHFDKYGAKK